MKNPISIGICFDHNVLSAAAVLLKSIMRNRNHSRTVNVYAVTTSLEPNFKAEFERVDGENFKVEIVAAENLNDKLPERDYITRAAYLRFMLPDLLQDVNKLIYLDIDTIVECDLSSLFDIDIKGRPLAAVPDYPLIFGSRYWRDCRIPYKGEQFTFRNYISSILNLSCEDDYFNSGVLLINLEYWRAHKLAEKLIAYLIADPELYFMDQDALSHYVGGDFVRLDPSWNVSARSSSRMNEIFSKSS